MNIKAQIAPFYEAEVDALAVPVYEEETPENSPLMRRIDERTGGAIGDLLATNELQGRSGETTYIHQPGRLRAKRLLLVGGGKRQAPGDQVLRRAAGAAARFLRSKNLKSMALLCRPERELEQSGRASAEGVLLGLFEGDTYKTKDKPGRFLEEIIIVAEQGPSESLEKGVSKGKVLAKATNFARNLVNEPAAAMTPAELAQRASDVASRFNLAIEVLDEPQMKEMDMGAILAVARGSDEPAKMIVMRYLPDADQPVKSEPIAFVGKGITFDSGGLSLKPAESMERMKYDMAGGAAVLGAMRALGQLRPRIPVIGIVPASENMPSGRAQKPGDVIRSLSGTTIEVLNTDAEGRLVLADGIAYARRLGAPRVVDIATLTGACVVALGSVYAAILGNDDQLVADLVAAGKTAGEPLWRMPLDDAYREQIKSSIADIKNIGGRKAGTITAAHFLSEFADDVAWAHLDIAGTAWLDEKKPYLAKGPTGVGVRTLVHLAEKLATAT